jgi:hypothetical protein
MTTVIVEPRRLEVCVRVEVPEVRAWDEEDGSIAFECTVGEKSFRGRFHDGICVMTWEKLSGACVIAAGATRTDRCEDNGPAIEDLVLWIMDKPRVGIVAHPQ